jgi:hypothetical protein
MRWLIDYLRQSFCKHEWLIEEEYFKETDTLFKKRYNIPKVYMRCKKCGYHKNHWKY